MGKKKDRKKDRKRDRLENPKNQTPENRGKVNPPQSFKQKVLEYAKAIGTALVIALLLRQFIFQAFRIPTGSMLETLQIGDFLFVNKFLYGAQTPERIRLGKMTLMSGLPVLKFPAIREPRQGDIIVFEYPRDRNLDYIKRCVAVAGDTVRVDGGVLYVNGDIYESNFADLDGDHSCIPNWADPQDCLAPHSKRDPTKRNDARMMSFPRRESEIPYIVPEGHIFMMGDNRYNSMDSRFWGPLDVNLIKGKAMFIYWSWNGDADPLGAKWLGLPRLNRIGDLIK